MSTTGQFWDGREIDWATEVDQLPPDSAKRDGHWGYPEELAKLDTPEAMRDAFGDTAVDFPSNLYIPQNEWRDRADFNDKNGLWAGNFIDRFTNQANTHECTSHALRCVAEACWNRQRRIGLGGPVAGQRLPISADSASVWLSCLSIYSQANPGEWGGANCQQVCEIAVSRGFLPDMIQPKEYGFKHTMHGTRGRGGINQSGNAPEYPSWSGNDFRRKPSHWTDANWRETAKHFRPLECVYPRNTEEFVCCLLHGYAIGIGRSGHSVPIIGIKYSGNSMTFPYYDSYDRTLYDSRAYYSGAYCILSMTSPDDWNKPAG